MASLLLGAVWKNKFPPIYSVIADKYNYVQQECDTFQPRKILSQFKSKWL